ncbi:MAG: hypothetical protein ACRDRJ_19555 [Streptosporangiaceae bacterium]
MVEQDAPLLVAAVTQDVSARADLARRLPGESVLLLFPDYATAARTLSEGDLGAVLVGRTVRSGRPRKTSYSSTHFAWT